MGLQYAPQLLLNELSEQKHSLLDPEISGLTSKV